jgi:PKD repeat protein
MMRRLTVWSFVGLLSMAAVGCAYDNPNTTAPVSPTPSSAPASIRTSASTRSDYTTAVVATVLTADGRFVPGIPIGFSTVNGTVSTSATVTDANGSATTIVTSAANTIVTVTIGALTTTVQVAGAAAPAAGTPPPPTPAPTPPSITPIAIINAPSTAITGSSVGFGVSAPAQGQTWTWNFGDGTTLQTTAFTTAHTYGTAGTYSITVAAPGITTGTASITVSNPGGSAASTLTATVTCTPAAHGSATPCNVSSVNYGSATIPSSSVTTVSWDWGDGSSGPGTTVAQSHTYVAAGTYNIVTTVTATTVDGAKTVTVVKSITIT